MSLIDKIETGIMFLIIIGGLVGLNLLSGNSYKPLIYKIFNDYEEECYEYEWYDEDYCIGYWINYNYTRVNGSWEKINVTESICRCGAWYPPGGCLRTRSLPNTSKCLKYHLVRKTGGVLTPPSVGSKKNSLNSRFIQRLIKIKILSPYKQNGIHSIQ